MALNPAIATGMFAALLMAGGCSAADKTVRADSPSLSQKSNDAQRQSTTNLVELERRADAAYTAGHNEQAALLYRDMVEAVPQQSEYWYRLANTLTRTERVNDAAEAYQQVLMRDPDNARAWHNLGVVRLMQAQSSFARGVEFGQPGDQVFENSLRLSTAVFDLTDDDRSGLPPNPAPSDKPPPQSDPTRTGSSP